MNALKNEKSPYLLQHAENPVDWHPWGEEAFKKARDENKPILLSIGYSTCHWCHVMEDESFSNPEIAKVMNENLVSIKVDREERPDIDKIYMTAVQMMTGQGGWPLNVFLTPDLKPFYGGTYFPPENRWGRVGWAELVGKVGQTWRDPQESIKIRTSADDITSQIGSFMAGRAQEGELKAALLREGFKALQADYDSVLGGFGGAPKFPMPVNHNFLLSYGTPEALEMVQATLRAMARGGIYDQLGGGFSRYSTDEKWHVPHFEKMLYDNSQLASVYLDAYVAGGDEFLAKTARETLDYCLRDMTSPEGAFYSAEDADSPVPGGDHKSEGAFYLWTKKEILGLLGSENGEIFSYVYGVQDHGNAESDPQGEFADKNILFLARSVEQAAAEFKTSDERVSAALESGRAMLLRTRSQRPRPHLDDKILTGWNGLMISALARGWQVLADPKYLDAARKAARFLSAELFDAKTGRLYRRWRQGEKKVAGLSDDHAFFAKACLDLFESDFDPQWYRLALRLTEELQTRFYDPANPGLFMAEKSADENLILRARDDPDNVEPAAASIAAMNALRIAEISGQKDWRIWAEAILKNFSGPMERNPRAHPQMLSTLAAWLAKPVQIVLSGGPSAELNGFLKSAYHSRLLCRALIVVADRWKVPQELRWVYDIVKTESKDRAPATAYVCADRACSLPVTRVDDFVDILRVK